MHAWRIARLLILVSIAGVSIWLSIQTYIAVYNILDIQLDIYAWILQTSSHVGEVKTQVTDFLQSAKDVFSKDSTWYQLVDEWNTQDVGERIEQFAFRLRMVSGIIAAVVWVIVWKVLFDICFGLRRLFSKMHDFVA